MMAARKRAVLTSVIAAFRDGYHPSRFAFSENATFAAGLAQAFEHIGYCAQVMPIFKQTRHIETGELLGESLVHCAANCDRATWDVNGHHARERFLEKFPAQGPRGGMIESYHAKPIAYSNVEAISKMCKTNNTEFSAKLASKVSSEIITLYFKQGFSNPAKKSTPNCPESFQLNEADQN